ncbi:class I SAM-dependent methyltransferase [Gammaproteobacteria bacterium AB-CW1]|uniref:Class I SAM-dependent methyltransferase n=1 Tax=Natronospira elongata TaxID=3110268 RepID=A0AAP6MLX9_9GAMM|nr:class I SAM-dependent methyltransferase [Gammaproteobacteria bacterium AB-CW1]
MAGLSGRKENRLIEAARAAAEKGDWQEAISVWEKLLKESEVDSPVEAYRGISKAKRKLGQLGRVAEVSKRFGDVPHMNESRAHVMTEIIRQNRCQRLLELGFAHGKSSAYIAACLEDIGEGHLTTIDLEKARSREPNIEQMLDSMGLSHRVEPIFAQKSYIWELTRMIQDGAGPRFDFCYIDGGHTWEVTGFGFVLVDMLLEPGGIVILDDMDWCLANSPAAKRKPAKLAKLSNDEKNAKGVRMTYELLAPQLGYRQLGEKPEFGFGWGLLQKPRH